MKKILLAISVIAMIGAVSAAEAVISPGTPDDIVLNSSNSYEVTKEFDGSASSPDSASHTWTWEENSTTKTGENVSFTFTRQNPQSNTIKLTVTSNTDSANDSVTQTLRDVPRISSASSSTSSVDLNDSEGKVDFKVAAATEFDSPLSYEWSLSDGTVVSNKANFTYNFNSTGSYDLTVNVSDSEGYYTTKTVGTVDVNNDTSSESNNQQTTTQNQGGSGNQQSFEEAFVFGEVTAGEQVEATFDDSPVTDVTIEFGESAEGTELKSQTYGDSLPDDAEPDQGPSGKVFEYVELKAVNFSEDEITNVTIEFSVSKDWINDNEIVEGSVSLYRYEDGEWEELDTRRKEENAEEVVLTASSPGFSMFSIAGEEASAEFKVTELTVSPENPEPGEKVSINVRVKNTGEKEGEYTVSFDLAGEKLKQSLSISPGSSKTASFSKKISANGTYTVEVEGESADIRVGSSGAVTSETGPNETVKGEGKSTGGSGILMPFLIFLVLLSLAGVGAFAYTDEEQREEIVDEVSEFLTGEDEEDELEVEWEGFED